MLAVISDLHSNLEALEAVLADIERQKVDRIVCLGDVVGYGPNPIEVTDIVMKRVAACIRGNHDEALTEGAWGFSGIAKTAIEWTREQLEPGFLSGSHARKRWEFLTTLPLTRAEGPDLFVHGSPRDPTTEYILAAEVGPEPSEKYEAIFASGFERFLFVGHTHLPCSITSGPDGCRATTAADLKNRFVHAGTGKAIINVGSVGQPRDGDNRACYALVSGSEVTWRRVAYDFERTAGKIAAIARLDARLGNRLRVGA